MQTPVATLADDDARVDLWVVANDPVAEAEPKPVEEGRHRRSQALSRDTEAPEVPRLVCAGDTEAFDLVAKGPLEVEVEPDEGVIALTEPRDGCQAAAAASVRDRIQALHTVTLGRELEQAAKVEARLAVSELEVAASGTAGDLVAADPRRLALNAVEILDRFDPPAPVVATCSGSSSPANSRSRFD